MDIEMPSLDGVAATERPGRWPGLAVVMLTVFEDEARIADALAAGAAGYLLKDEPAEAIVAAVLDAARGGSPVSDPVAATLVRRVRTQETARREAPPPRRARPDDARARGVRDCSRRASPTRPSRTRSSSASTRSRATPRASSASWTSTRAPPP